ncbi:hypothetical protein [Mesorhizobium tianshanense]|uniref:hypothetical protein n=1 Tax=Mesorhizobium tianshanense TaxID=39844 RepID=UPI0011AA5A92|nr:hypothetical protein [Mesorhizobium tianshanense]
MELLEAFAPNADDAVRERASRYRGGVAVFDRLNPRQTAHIIVDLQNGFMDHGQVAEAAMARTIVPNVNRISAALREAAELLCRCQRGRFSRRLLEFSRKHCIAHIIDLFEALGPAIAHGGMFAVGQSCPAERSRRCRCFGADIDQQARWNAGRFIASR